MPDRWEDWERLGLSVRVTNILKMAHRSRGLTVEQLRDMSDSEVLGLRNCGRKALEEIRTKIPEPDTWRDALRDERNMLRAEVDHLKQLLIATSAENERLGIDMRAWKQRAQTAEAENERLREEIATHIQLREAVDRERVTEIERLRAIETAVRSFMLHGGWNDGPQLAGLQRVLDEQKRA